jgi:hypothetical protein
VGLQILNSVSNTSPFISNSFFLDSLLSLVPKLVKLLVFTALCSHFSDDLRNVSRVAAQNVDSVALKIYFSVLEEQPL